MYFLCMATISPVSAELNLRVDLKTLRTQSTGYNKLSDSLSTTSHLIKEEEAEVRTNTGAVPKDHTEEVDIKNKTTSKTSTKSNSQILNKTSWVEPVCNNNQTCFKT